MLRFAARSVPALLLLVLVGCAGSAADGTGTTEGAATIAPAADARTPASLAGNYGGRMGGEWDGSLSITNASPEKFDFAFEISPDREDVARFGRLGGTATLQNGSYHYEDGRCTIDFERVTTEPGARRGDLFLNASIPCGLYLEMEGHSTYSTAFDLTATWLRL